MKRDAAAYISCFELTFQAALAASAEAEHTFLILKAQSVSAFHL